MEGRENMANARQVEKLAQGMGRETMKGWRRCGHDARPGNADAGVGGGGGGDGRSQLRRFSIQRRYRRGSARAWVWVNFIMFLH